MTDDEPRPGHEVRPETDRLLLDVMLGKLAVYLRAAGYDAAYAGDRGIEADDRLLELAEAEERTLLSRDERLVERADEALLLTRRDVRDQLAELRRAGVLIRPAAEPSRCGRCNGRLDPVPPTSSTPAYAPDPAETDCWRCRSCGQVFWRGSHWDRLVEALSSPEGDRRLDDPD